MVIVSQGKGIICNWDNATDVYVKGTIVTLTDVCGEKCLLGLYESEERAKAVLDKLINAIGLNMYMYQMPKK